jgi:WD40 repeat protein
MEFKGRGAPGGKAANPVRLFDLRRNVELDPLLGHDGPTMAATFSPDGRRLASCSWDGSLRLWEMTTRKEIWQYKPETLTSLNSVSFSPDGRWLASAGYTAIYICEVATGKETYRIKGPDNGLTAAVFSPDGRIIASANMDSTILLWNSPTALPARVEASDTKYAPEKLESLWSALGGEDARAAHEAGVATRRSADAGSAFPQEEVEARHRGRQAN